MARPAPAAELSASETQPSEIPDNEKLLEVIEDAILDYEAWHDDLGDSTDCAPTILKALCPYLRSPEPMSVSLEQIARRVQKHAREAGDDSPVDYGDAEGLARVVLNAAGVKYAD